MQRHLRLRRKDDFAHLRQTGRAWRHPFFMLSVAPNTLTHNRYGFVTGRHLGNAVTRNRVRRRLRAVVQDVHPHVRPGHDIALIARGPVAGQPYTSIREAMITLLQRADLWEVSPGDTSP
ncbi:MAG: ribonuclease P protein component [Chloroflexi bacterium]|nr:ribonuclease P protein component [Chloroflexota bacterium]